MVRYAKYRKKHNESIEGQAQGNFRNNNHGKRLAKNNIHNKKERPDAKYSKNIKNNKMTLNDNGKY